MWSTYSGRDLKVTTDAGTFTGRVRGERFSFTGPVTAILGAGFNRSTLLSSAAQPATDAPSF